MGAALSILEVAACNKSAPSDPSSPSATASATTSTTSPNTSSTPSASVAASSSAASAPSGACKTDADCRTFSSYCGEAPCVCRALLAKDPNPSCASQGKVACLVDPCMRKTAACQGGRCELVVAATK